MPIYNTDMNAIIASLDAKIAGLQQTRKAVQDALDRNIAPTVNASALAQLNQSLEIAQKARVAIADDCCGANCGITWEEAPRSS